MNKQVLMYIGLVLLGALAADKILALPVVNKLPRF